MDTIGRIAFGIILVALYEGTRPKWPGLDEWTVADDEPIPYLLGPYRLGPAGTRVAL